jgi:hypothetical protein
LQDADAETAGKIGKGGKDGKGGKGGICYEDEDEKEEEESGTDLIVKLSALETSSSKRVAFGLASVLSVSGLVIGLTTM